MASSDPYRDADLPMPCPEPDPFSFEGLKRAYLALSAQAIEAEMEFNATQEAQSLAGKRLQLVINDLQQGCGF